MLPVGFEPTIPVFEWAKTFLALYYAADVIGNLCPYDTKIEIAFSDRHLHLPEHILVKWLVEAFRLDSHLRCPAPDI
jgi:hypothetical protein